MSYDLSNLEWFYFGPILYSRMVGAIFYIAVNYGDQLCQFVKTKNASLRSF